LNDPAKIECQPADAAPDVFVLRNALDATEPLPWFYWSGKTRMSCMREALTHTHDHAYSHHIQRLMITGNFALLAGINPKAVHEWHLAVYADAHEWAEAPNTIGRRCTPMAASWHRSPMLRAATTSSG